MKKYHTAQCKNHPFPHQQLHPKPAYRFYKVKSIYCKFLRILINDSAGFFLWIEPSVLNLLRVCSSLIKTMLQRLTGINKNYKVVC